ncbi:MAG: hypothetical protein QOH49_491 [Acidobacteriota bacterium]|jgi:hypothetical protein|nr:hypothetical protein [Acidobacteriota bacterium]
MPNHTTLVTDDKGASDKVLSPLSGLQTQLPTHETLKETSRPRVTGTQAAQGHNLPTKG